MKREGNDLADDLRREAPERIDAQLPAVGVGFWREHEGELADVQALVVCEGARGPHLSKVREPTIAIRNMLQIRKRCAGAEWAWADAPLARSVVRASTSALSAAW